MKQSGYDELGSVLQPTGVLSSVAELHGTLSGVLCTDPAGAREKWLSSMSAGMDGEVTLTEASESSLGRVYGTTRAALESSDMTFYPLLPSDEAPLQERARALALWCQGFLHGMSLGSIPDESRLSAEANEVVTDFAEITKAELDEDEDPEEAEEAYAELVEFVRVGVQLLFEELTRASASNTRRTLH